MRVALTFDDGPDDLTGEILDILAAHDARATFFVIGQKIRGRQPLLQRIVAEGHEIGIHGWDHTHTSEMTTKHLIGQIRLTQQAVRQACSVIPRLWRSPWNQHSDDVALTILEQGCGIVGIDIDSYDCVRDADEIVENVLEQLRAEVTICLHDGVAPNAKHPEVGREQTVLALPRILEHCHSVTVSELRDLG